MFLAPIGYPWPWKSRPPTVDSDEAKKDPTGRVDMRVEVGAFQGFDYVLRKEGTGDSRAHGVNQNFIAYKGGVKLPIKASWSREL